MFCKTLTASLLALGLLAGASAASAQSTEIATVKVSVAGLNSGSPASAKIILRRIRNAAAKVCGPEPTAPLERMSHFDPCVKAATDRAVASMHDPVLTALNGGPTTSSVLASAR